MLPILRQILLALLFTAVARAGAFEDANASYNSGDYARAAAAYDTLIQSEGPTAARLYNLGNARLRLKEYGPAILAYERALLLTPRDADLRAHLKIARDAAAAHDELNVESWWEYPLQWCSLREWSFLTIAGAIALAAAALTWGLFGLRRPFLKPVVITSLAIGSVFVLGGASALWHRRGETTLGIVTSSKPTLRLSPFATAESAGTCTPGRTVQLGKRVPGWVHVKLRGSETAGWLPEGDTGALMP